VAISDWKIFHLGRALPDSESRIFRLQAGQKDNLFACGKLKKQKNFACGGLK